MQSRWFLAITLCCVQSLFAQPGIDRVDSFLTTMNKGEKFNGGILIAEKGKILYEKYFGFSDFKKGIPNNTASTFNIASVSKTFTATAILQLMEKKKLSLDDPFVKYFPDFPYPEVKIRQMLTHTSGIPSEFDFFKGVVQKYPDSVLLNRDVIAVLKDYHKPLLFHPGDQYRYCNANYELLALLVEKLSHLSFAEYLHQFIFHPVHMEHSYVRLVEAPLKDDHAVINQVLPYFYSTGYENVDSVKSERFQGPNKTFGGTVGDNNVITTLEDLWMYDRALNGEGLLHKSTLRVAYAATRLNDGKIDNHYWRDSTLPGASYGLGWMTRGGDSSDKIVFHGGYNFGIASMLYRNISRGLTIIFFDNTNGDHLYKTLAIARFLDGKEPRAAWSFAFDTKKSIAREYGSDLLNKGADAALIHLWSMKNDSVHYYLNRREITLLGYDLLGSGYKEAGWEAFRVSTLLYPQDAGAFGNYAVALSDNGYKEEAIEVFKTALQQHPDDKTMKGMLDETLKEKKADDSASAGTLAFDQLIAATLKEGGPGGVVFIARGGKPIYEKAFGIANLELNIPMRTDMVFQIASTTKQFTAICILQLMEQGKLSLEDDIKKYLPGMADTGQKITIEHLLTHTSGIIDRASLNKVPEQSGREFIPPDLIKSFLQEPRAFAPGTQYVYSNSGYIILGYILEKVSGMRYGDYLEKFIFIPLGMTRSSYGNNRMVISDRVPAYLRGPHGFENFRTGPMPYSAGGILSTVEDLYKWNQALQKGRLVRRETLEKALTSYRLANGRKTGYGYGWQIGEIQGSPVIEHGGNMGGYMTDALYLRHEDLFVAVFMNFRGLLPEILTGDLAALAIGKPYHRVPIVLDRDLLKTYTGVYADEEGVKRTITIDEDGQLYYQRADGGPRFHMVPYGKDKFFFENTSSMAEIRRGGSGEVALLALFDRRRVNDLPSLLKKSDAVAR